MFMFRTQFDLKASESKGFRSICLFIVMFYVKSWFIAPCAIMAPAQDLNLLQDLIRYREIDAKTSDTAAEKLRKHSWYMSEDLAGLAFFDSTISNNDKLKMVDAIKNRESFAKDRTHAAVDLRDVTNKDISYFITKKSLFLFDQFKLSYDFLDENPEQWDNNASCLHALTIFKNLQVVNDIAERGVALIEEYNQCLIKDEDQHQYLLRIVANHRKKYPICNVNVSLKQSD